MYCSDHPSSSILLDVFAGRTRVECWYAGLGFREIERRCWCLSPGPPTPNPRPPTPDPWGFSNFVVTTRGGEYRIGRLYAPYFRLIDRAAAEDPQLRETLRAMDPSRRLLLIAPGEPPSGWRQVAVSRRLECPKESLSRLARLYRGPASAEKSLGAARKSACATSASEVPYV